MTAEAADEYRHKASQHDLLIKFLSALDRDRTLNAEFVTLQEAGKKPGDILFTLFQKFKDANDTPEIQS